MEELQQELDGCEAEERRLQQALYDTKSESEAIRLEAKLEYAHKKAEQAKRHMVKVGEKISISPYSDWHSYTIISRTKDTLTARADRQLAFKDCWQDGEMHCEEDPNGQIIRLTWSKVSNRWCYGIYKTMVGEYNYRDPSF